MAYITPQPGFTANYPASLNINGVLSANPPLGIAGTTLSIADASLLNSGIVNTGAQSLAGAKTFAGPLTVTDATVGAASVAGNALQVAGTIGTPSGIWSGGAINMDTAVGVLGTTPANSIMTVQANGGANIELQSSPNGHIVATTGSFAGSEVQLIDGNTTNPIATFEAGSIALYGATSITLPGASPMNLVGSGGNTLFTISTGDLTINCSGNDLNLHSTDKIHVLNTTDSTSLTTGALTVSGGIGCESGVWSAGLRVINTVGPQLTVTHSVGNLVNETVDSSGNLTVASSGPTQTYRQASTDTVVMGSTLTKLNVGVEFAGYTKFDEALATLSPSGAGPFDDYALTIVDTLFYIDLASVTTGAHFTGFAFASLIKNRMVELIFISTGGSKTIYIDHEGGASTAAYRVWCPGSANLTITVNVHAVVRMLYSNYDDRWLVMSAI